MGLWLGFRAYALAIKDHFLIGGSSDPFFEVCRLHASETSEGVTWVPVYRSNVIKKNLNPEWEEFSVPLWAANDADEPIQISIYDHDYDGGHDLIGHVTSTLRELKARMSTVAHSDKDVESMKGKCPLDCMPVVHPNTKKKYDPA